MTLFLGSAHQRIAELAKNISTICIFSISYDINIYHDIHVPSMGKDFPDVCYGVFTPNGSASLALDYLQDAFRVTRANKNIEPHS